MQALNSSKINQTNSQNLAGLLKSAGDPLRLEILRVLAQDSFGVLELSHIFEVKQNSMSHHLKVLAGANLVTTRREGNSIFYRRSVSTSDNFAPIHQSLFESIDALALADSTQNGIADIQAQRAQASQTFFAEHGNSLKEKQDLIAAFDVYGEHVANFITHSSLNSYDNALEIGPGAGEFLPLLSHRFTKVTALDNSQTMLQSANNFCADSGLQNVQFELADTHYCRQHPDVFDCAVINMVLHHIPSPQQVFADVYLTLRNNGVLIICELCQHNQDWTRQACGDLWLGFEPNELSQWAQAAQFTEGQSSYFALRNGFQIQIREFIKHTR